MSLFGNKESVKGKKSLIIYYSRKGQNYTNHGIQELSAGNTEVIAKMICEITGGELFEIKPAKEYPIDYTECTVVAKEELRVGARPELQEYLEDISDYEVIYIGYPNWWGTMPMPMMTQLEKLDFTDKIVMPFCTHEGSAMGNSESDIKRICKGANVLKGLPIQGSFVSTAKSKVEQWIE